MTIRRMSKVRFVLEALGAVGFATLDSFFPRKYTRARSARILFGLDAAPRISRHDFSSVLWRLKREGLVARTTREGNAGWSITSKGEKTMKCFRPVIFVPPSDGIMRLVIFDIPEKERKKRRALRAELISFNFSQLQKSVWAGENPLPEDFLSFLDELNLKNKVHIFSVRKHGTLQK